MKSALYLKSEFPRWRENKGEYSVRILAQFLQYRQSKGKCLTASSLGASYAVLAVQYVRNTICLNRRWFLHA